MKKEIKYLLVIICVFCVVGGTYLFVDMTKQIEIDELTTQISNLNEIDKDRQEFDRFFTRGMDALGTALLNKGYAQAYDDEADDSYDANSFYWGEFYYLKAREYYGFTSDWFGDAKLLFSQAQDYATSSETLELTQKYIEYVNLSREMANIDQNICDTFGLACGYFNSSMLDEGNAKITEVNEFTNQRNELIDPHNDALAEIDFLLEESSWV